MGKLKIRAEILTLAQEGAGERDGVAPGEGREDGRVLAVQEGAAGPARRRRRSGGGQVREMEAKAWALALSPLRDCDMPREGQG